MRFIASYHLPRILYLWLLLQISPEVKGQIPREEHRQFADSLTSELYANGNECTSSWGVSMLFDLLRPGSSGNTRNQLCDIMGLCGRADELLWNDTVSALTTEYDGRCMDGYDGECYRVSPTVKVANSIWIDIISELQAAYKDVAGEYLQRTDFASQDAGATVNKWVNASTLGLINSILDEGPIPFNLVAINSIYLKAYWTEPFNEERTNEDVFYTDPSRTETVPDKAHFMHTVRSMPYSDELLPGYQIIQLDYHGGGSILGAYCDLSLVVILPLGLDKSPVSSEEVLEALPSLDYRRVALALPKFRIETKYEEKLKVALMSLGLTAPFDERQGFCGLLEGEPCQFIDLLIQKTFIEVDENGTVAAAVTLAALDGAAPPTDGPVLFIADHPFQFFIYSPCGDVVLFEGRVGAPNIPSDWPPAQFQSLHSDPDFWTSNFYNVDTPVEPTMPSTSTTQPPVQPTQPVTLRDDLNTSSSAKSIIHACCMLSATVIVLFCMT